MKFEKLGENKIKITLSIEDLEEKDISFHDFMSNSIETQDLFLDMLAEAEEKIGFKTRNCKIKIEALAMTEDDFVLTVTRILPDSSKKYLYISRPKKPKIRRKVNKISTSCLVYKFNSFDDYCNFIECLIHNKLSDANKVAEKIYVYLYNTSYYLVLLKLNTEYKKLSTFYTTITEFGTYVTNSDLVLSRLNESGMLFIKSNALKKGFSYFLQK